MVQTKEEKQKEIDNAVRIFRETLEKTYLEIEEEFHGIGVQPMIKLINGQYMRTNKDILKIPVGVKATEVVKDNIKGIPMNFKDWKCFPLVIWLNHEVEK